MSEIEMTTTRKLRGKWQAMVRRKGIAPRSKGFDKKSEAEKDAEGVCRKNCSGSPRSVTS